MGSIKGSKTEKNLLAAFAGESQAANRYLFAAKRAEKEGFRQIADIFRETADNERLHAKRFFSFLEGGAVEITASYPAGKLDETEANLLAAAEGEKEEWTHLYPQFAAIAKEEGFTEVAGAFTQIAKAEKAHEERFAKLLTNVREKRVFQRDSATKWKCKKCGYVHDGKMAPNKCPACLHEQEHFEILAENY